jgi:hypothetical protein
MQNEVKDLFREVANLSVAERERYLEQHSVPPHTRAELESLLGYDSDHSVTFSQAVRREACEFFEDGVVDPHNSLAGQVVGAYTLVSEIGHGGMGSVWLAERSDGRFEGRVAVEFLNIALADRTGGERSAGRAVSLHGSLIRTLRVSWTPACRRPASPISYGSSSKASTSTAIATHAT